MTKAVIFDFFGVVVSTSLPKFFKQNNVKKDDYDKLLHDLDIGVITFNDALTYMANITGTNNQYVLNSLLSQIKVNEELVNYINKLQEKTPVYLLTNSNYDYINKILNYYKLENIFTKLYISSTLKMIKPNKDIFLYVLNDLNIKGDEAIFIDDTLKNVDGAKAVFVNSLLYTSLEETILKIEQLIKNSNLN